MPVSDRSQELIQKYFDALASEAELAELEGLLASDPSVADAFANAARLHHSLQSHFRKQYKIDQVAALLETPTSSPASSPGAGAATDLSRPDVPVKSPSDSDSSFIPIDARLIKSRRRGSRPPRAAKRLQWKWIAALSLVCVVGVSVWFATSGVERPRLVSGQLLVDGREVTVIPVNATFVVGNDPAQIQLPGGANVELRPATRVRIRRQAERTIVLLESGRGDFSVLPGQWAFDVETVLGVVSTTGGRFSLDLMTTLPEQISRTEPVHLPRLTVAVSEGSVTLAYDGILKTISAGEQQIFPIGV